MPQEILNLGGSAKICWEGVSNMIEAQVSMLWNDYLLSQHSAETSGNAFIHFKQIEAEKTLSRSSDTFEKLHVALNTKTEVQLALNPILKILHNNGIHEFKIILFSRFDEMMNGDQAGKVFTIYFNNSTIRKIDLVAQEINESLKNISGVMRPTKTAITSKERPDHAILGCDFVTIAIPRNQKTYCYSFRGTRGIQASTHSLDPRSSAGELSARNSSIIMGSRENSFFLKPNSCYGKVLTSFNGRNSSRDKATTRKNNSFFASGQLSDLPRCETKLTGDVSKTAT